METAKAALLAATLGTAACEIPDLPKAEDKETTIPADVGPQVAEAQKLIGLHFKVANDDEIKEAGGLALRPVPSSQTADVFPEPVRLAPGTSVTVVAATPYENSTGHWLNVVTSEGQAGWVHPESPQGNPYLDYDYSYGVDTEPKATTAPAAPEAKEVASSIQYVKPEVTQYNGLALRKAGNRTAEEDGARLTAGTEVTVIGEPNKDGYVQVKVGERTGYVGAIYLSKEKAAPEAKEVAPTTQYVKPEVTPYNGLALRKAGNRTAEEDGARLAAGTEVTVIGEPNADGYVQVKVGDRTGYVGALYLSKEKAAPAAPTAPAAPAPEKK